jgi:hypothetical protein
MDKKRHLLKILWALLLILTYTSCTEVKPITELKKQPPMHIKLEWAAGVCAPELYPVEVYRGDFYMSTDWESIPNGGSVDAGWGDNGMNMGETSIIPEGFEITYFSYFENKFYTGKFELPQARIKQLFEEGVIDYTSKQFETYIAIIVGMAPEGVLVVWMMTYDKQVEIGRYQASEMDLEWEIFKPTVRPNKREEFIKVVTGRLPEALANFQKNGLSHGLWDTYRIKYNWRPQFEFPKGCVVEGIDLSMYNGETDFIWGGRLAKNAYEKRALTWRINLLWADEHDEDFGTFIDMDEAEIFDAYKKIYRNNKDLDAELVFKYNHNRSSLIVLLRSDTEEIELRKCTVQFFKRAKRKK